MSAKSAPQEASRVVGSQIRARREALRLTQKDLAAFAHIDPARLEACESGAESLYVTDLLAICLVLDCAPQSLLPTTDKGTEKQGEYVPRWMAEARALNALHPNLFGTLKRLPENRLRLMLINMQAMCQPSICQDAASGATEQASA